MTETLIERGTSRTRGGTQTLLFRLRLPQPVDKVWEAVATPEGLPGWLAAADVLEPRLGGAVTLRWLNTDAEGNTTTVTGHVTAWDTGRVAEYTVAPYHGRIRFHLEAATDASTTLRFTNEFDGDDAMRLDSLAGWHQHFEYLADALQGRAADWSTWTLDRWRELRARYAEHVPGK